jgi:hypothetical protein
VIVTAHAERMKRSACSRLPATATTIEGRSMSSGSRSNNCRLGWNITCRCGPALMWCHAPPSSGMVCCVRGGCGCGCSDILHVSSHQMCVRPMMAAWRQLRQQISTGS